MSFVLEINDCALSLYRNGQLEYQAPAIALLQPDEILFGELALRQARIHPRQANQQYLARLNADPLPHPVSRAANQADLVFLHLQEFISKVADAGEDLLLAVPSIMSNDQLGVLLGIVQETGVSVCGFVDAATAAATTAKVPATTHHIELHLQRTCVTKLGVSEQVQRQGAEEIGEVGLSNLLDGWVNVIADRFVRDTRFDPLHAAETEQQLYNQVYDWVLGPGSDTTASPATEIGIDIDYQDHVRHVELPRAVLEEKAQQRFQLIADALPDNAHVTLSARCARLPGLRQGLTRAGHEVTTLDDHALAQACAKQMSTLRSADGQLRLVTKLPHGQPTPTTDAPAPRVGNQPTHILDYGSATAIPIDAGPAELAFAIRSTPEGVFLAHRDDTVLINGEPAEAGSPLNAGDRISHGEARYLLISVDG